MAGVAAIGEGGRSRASVRDVAGSFLFAAATLVALSLGARAVKQVEDFAGSWLVWAPLLTAVAAAVVFAGTRYADFTTLLRASIRASAVGVMVYVLVEWPDFTLAHPEAAAGAAYVAYGHGVALVCGALAVWRPAFLVPVAIYVITTRHLARPISGLNLSVLDIQYMIDMALYLTIFGIGVVKVGPRIHPWLARPDRQNEIVGVGFGLHLANYFWSGVAKLLLGPTPWDWIVHNATHNQIPYAIESGMSPLGQWPEVAQAAFDAFGAVVVPLNAFIVAAQLFALVCIFNRTWLKLTSLFYDVLHIGIYVAGGLFFWPWIWNNLTIWWAAQTMDRPLARHTQVACVATILLAAPFLHLNKAAWLGWYDMADAREVYFEAVTRDGRAVKVPNAFFLSHSYSISHGYIGNVPLLGHYPQGIQLTSRNAARNLTSGSCPNPSMFEATPETPAAHEVRRRLIDRFIVAHHAKMLGRADMLGGHSYYFRSHHHPSNPLLFEDFNRLSLREVVGYNLVIESDCFRLDKGRVRKKVWARDAEYFGV